MEHIDGSGEKDQDYGYALSFDQQVTKRVTLFCRYGFAIRTPAEDIKWEEEQKELEANAPKGGKAPPKGKKK